jgi:hypothetical protein
MTVPSNPSRRDALRLGVFAGAGLAFGRWPRLDLEMIREQQQLPLITKPIPSTGQRIPVVGIGTNAFGATTAEAKAPLRDVLRRLPEIGGSVVDTAQGYGQSEAVIGELVKEIGNRDRIFLVTKTSTNADAAAGRALM